MTQKKWNNSLKLPHMVHFMLHCDIKSIVSQSRRRGQNQDIKNEITNFDYFFANMTSQVTT